MLLLRRRNKINLTKITLREWLQIEVISNGKSKKVYVVDMQPGRS